MAQTKVDIKETLERKTKDIHSYELFHRTLALVCDAADTDEKKKLFGSNVRAPLVFNNSFKM